MDGARDAEIAELRAALASTQAELDDWRFTNRVDELERALAVGMQATEYEARHAAELEVAIATTPAPSVPQGWRLVPEESTGNMVTAFHCEDGESASNKWRAMLAAAPPAPHGDKP